MKHIVSVTSMVTHTREIVIEVPDDARVETTGGRWTIKVPSKSAAESQGRGSLWLDAKAAIAEGYAKLIEVL